MDTEDLFFEQNITRVNDVVSKILLITAIVPLSFIILSYAKIWAVPETYSFLMLFYSVVSFVITSLLNKNRKCQKFVMYAGLFLTAGFVQFLAVNKYISVSLTFAAVPFISCFYYNRKLTLISTIASFILMLGSLYIKSFDIVPHMLEWYQKWTPGSWYISTIAGFTIEFFFIGLVAIFMGKRTNKTLISFMKISNEKNESEHKLIVQNEKLKETQDNIIAFVASVLGSHDLFTGRHVMHTKVYVRIIAEKMVENGYYVDELDEEMIHMLETAAFLHDLGKIHIPEGVLNKIGKFTDAEFEIMKSHPEEGKKLLEILPKIGDGTFNQIAMEMAYTHHEKWNGKGYPRGIKGLDIPLSGRIMAAADVLDALISKRLYKEPFSIDDALKIFEESKGEQFEPCIADCVIMSKELIQVYDADFKTNEAATEEKEFNWWKNYHDSLKQVALT